MLTIDIILFMCYNKKRHVLRQLVRMKSSRAYGVNLAKKAIIFMLYFVFCVCAKDFFIFSKNRGENMPSAKVLEAKQIKVAEIEKMLKESCSGVLVDYKGISVEDDTKLRRELREAGVTYFVEKNTLLKRAFEAIGLSKLDDVLEGPTAIAISKEDQTAPARILGKYAEKDERKFNLKAGFIGAEIYDENGVKALSKIPSKDVLLAQLVGSLQGPIQKLAAVLKALQEKQEAA